MGAPVLRGTVDRAAGRGERGSTTIELAIGFGVVVLILALILALSSIGITRQQLCRAAGEAARAAVEGASDPDLVGSEALGALLGRGARVYALREGAWVTAKASLPAHGLIGWAIPEASCEVRARLSVMTP